MFLTHIFLLKGNMLHVKGFSRTMKINPSFKYIFVFIDFRNRQRKRERRGVGGRGSLFHTLTHLLVDSCLCPEQGSNPQPWHMGKITN